MALGWILRILAILLVIRLLMKFVGGIMRGLAGAPAAGRASTPQPRVGGRLVRDPHCGTHIPETRALRLGTGDKTVYFCSETCRERWAAAHTA